MKAWLITKNVLKGIFGVVIVLLVIYFLLAIYAVVSSNFGLPIPARPSYSAGGNETFSNALGWKADSGRGIGEIYVGQIKDRYYSGLENNFCLGLTSVSDINQINKDCFGVYIQSESA